MVNDVK